LLAQGGRLCQVDQPVAAVVGLLHFGRQGQEQLAGQVPQRRDSNSKLEN
jgi:hypothetical protein